MLEIPAKRKQTLAAAPNIEKLSMQKTKLATAARISTMPTPRHALLFPKKESTKQIAVVTTGSIDHTPSPEAVAA